MKIQRTSSSLWRSRQLIWELTSRELKQRYRGTFLGGFWSVLNPLIMLAIYTFVFSFVFQARWPTLKTGASNWEFAFILFAGLIPFNLFSEICNRAPALIVNSPSYVKKVIFPLEVLPPTALLVAIITSLINTLVLLVGSAVFLKTISPTLYQLVLVYPVMILLNLTLGWLISALGVYIRDISQAIVFIVQVMMFVSPVFYSPTIIPEKFQGIYQLNPLTFIITSFRQTILWGENINWVQWGLWMAILLATTLLSYKWFMRAKRGFADVM
jgi:lipopolysaccharide transport system permease protein